MLKTYENLDDLKNIKSAVISTNRGDIKVSLNHEAPQAVLNFAHLANEHFYDNLKFHRVIAGFVAQGGCPKGSGTGGPGWEIACECSGQKAKHKKGALSMAHAGPNTGGSQFFLCFASLPHLDGVHTVFGQIEDDESLAVLDEIMPNDEIKSIKISCCKDSENSSDKGCCEQ